VSSRKELLQAAGVVGIMIAVMLIVVFIARRFV
jgi:preprotein translocase subunit SecE